MAEKTDKPMGKRDAYKQIRADILDCVDTLLDRHMKDIKQVIDEEANGKAGLSFGIAVDYSEAAPVVKVTFSLPTSIKDSETRKAEDPNQEQIPGTEPEKTGKKGSRKSKEQVQAEEEAKGD